jgi:hypothetical protein
LGAVGKHLDTRGHRLAQRAAVFEVDAVGGTHLRTSPRCTQKTCTGRTPCALRRISSRKCREPRSLTQSGKSATPREAAAVTFFTST